MNEFWDNLIYMTLMVSATMLFIWGMFAICNWIFGGTGLW